MPHDQVVHPRHIIDALSNLDRAGNGRMLADLEAREPQLASYAMEHLSILHGALMDLGAPAKRTQRVYQRTEGLLLVCLQAQRTAHRELWDTEPLPPPSGITPYLAPVTAGCPLCGSPNGYAEASAVPVSEACARSFRCHECSSRWSLICILTDRNPLPTTPS